MTFKVSSNEERHNQPDKRLINHNITKGSNSNFYPNHLPGCSFWHHHDPLQVSDTELFHFTYSNNFCDLPDRMVLKNIAPVSSGAFVIPRHEIYRPDPFWSNITQE